MRRMIVAYNVTNGVGQYVKQTFECNGYDVVLPFLKLLNYSSVFGDPDLVAMIHVDRIAWFKPEKPENNQ